MTHYISFSNAQDTLVQVFSKYMFTIWLKKIKENTGKDKCKNIYTYLAMVNKERLKYTLDNKYYNK